MKLEETRARVVLRLRKDGALRQDAALAKRSESLLGDYLLKLYPGSEDAPPLAAGGTISRVVDQQGMEAVFGSLEQITGDIREVTRSLRGVLGGEQGPGALKLIVDNLVRLSASLDQVLRRSAERLEVILGHVQGASSNVKAITDEQREPIREVVASVEAIARDVRELLASARSLVGGGDGGQPLEASAATQLSALGKLDRGLDNIEGVTEGLKAGQGVAGTLLRDGPASQRLNEAIEEVSVFASRLSQLRMEVGVHSEYLATQGQAKSFLQLRMFPRPDTFYLLEVVDDPRGTVETATVRASPASAGDPALKVQRFTRQGLKVSAQLARRYSFATLRLGIIESSGGVGADLHLFEDALSLRLDAFDSSSDALRCPRVRAALRLQARHHLFATVGVDDLATASRRDAAGRFLLGQDFSLGGGVFFADEDLQAPLTVSPLRPCSRESVSMSLLVVGSIAYDSVETPFGSREEVLGGSATFFSASASFFTSVRAVAVVGEDFDDKHFEFLRARGVDLSGVSRVKGRTFRWKGRYSFQLNEAQTLNTQLNVFQSFSPTLPEAYRDSEYVFLGNIHPELQAQVVEQVRSPKLIAMDTMNFWIQGSLPALKKTLSRVDLLFVNDGEARQLAGEHNIVQAAKAILAMGPRRLVIKRGEYGALLFDQEHVFWCPAYPLAELFDPTGAGDSFAGGFMGSVALHRSLSHDALRRAMVTGSVMGSFAVERFSLDRFREIGVSDIRQRYKDFQRLTEFAELPA